MRASTHKGCSMTTDETMEAAVDILNRHGFEAYFDHPGYIFCRGLAFGDLDGDAYRFNREDCEPIEGATELPIDATPEALAAWVEESVTSFGVDE